MSKVSSAHSLKTNDPAEIRRVLVEIQNGLNQLQTPASTTLAAPTGTPTYTTFNTATVTTTQLAERVYALYVLLAAKGII